LRYTTSYEEIKVKTLHVVAAPLAAAMLIAGCATQDQPYYGSNPSSSYPNQTYPAQTYPTYPSQGYPSQTPQSYYMGYVDRIEVINKGGDTNNIAGTVIGGIIGGLIGHQIGSGAAATRRQPSPGAAGGALAGHEIQGTAEDRERDLPRDGTPRQRVLSDRDAGKHHWTCGPGDRVRVDGNNIYRV
jgi:outer membrane lipoprotein SlyB